MHTYITFRLPEQKLMCATAQFFRTKCKILAIIACNQLARSYLFSLLFSFSSKLFALCAIMEHNFPGCHPTVFYFCLSDCGFF